MKLETKFNEGDEVFFIENRKVCSSIVRGIKIECIAGQIITTYLCNKDEESTVKLKVMEDTVTEVKRELGTDYYSSTAEKLCPMSSYERLFEQNQELMGKLEIALKSLNNDTVVEDKRVFITDYADKLRNWDAITLAKEQLDVMMENVFNSARELKGNNKCTCYFAVYPTFKDYQDRLPADAAVEDNAYQCYLKDCDCETGGIIFHKGIAVCRWCRKPYGKGAMINYLPEHFEQPTPQAHVTWAVQKGTFHILDTIHELDNPENWYTFASKEGAEKYQLENKPCLSINDVNSCCHDDSAGGGTLYLSMDKLVKKASEKLKQ